VFTSVHKPKTVADLYKLTVKQLGADGGGGGGAIGTLDWQSKQLAPAVDSAA
tara:strand:- start:19 stop:174 length:156 start_codon:yes stop_codon:yes gene_type:complete